MVSLWRLGGRLMAMTNEVKTGLMVSGAFASLVGAVTTKHYFSPDELLGAKPAEELVSTVEKEEEKPPEAVAAPTHEASEKPAKAPIEEKSDVVLASAQGHANDKDAPPAPEPAGGSMPPAPLPPAGGSPAPVGVEPKEAPPPIPVVLPVPVGGGSGEKPMDLPGGLMPPPLEAVKPKVDDPVKLPGAGAPFDPIASALGAPPPPAPPAPVESLAPLAPGGSGSFAPPPPLPLPGGSGSFAPPPPPLSASGGLGSFAPPPLSPTPVDSPPLSLGSAPKSPVNLNETFPSEPGKPGIARVLTFPVATGPAKRSEFIPIDEEPLPGGTGGLAAPGLSGFPAGLAPAAAPPLASLPPSGVPGNLIIKPGDSRPPSFVPPEGRSVPVLTMPAEPTAPGSSPAFPLAPGNSVPAPVPVPVPVPVPAPAAPKNPGGGMAAGFNANPAQGEPKPLVLTFNQNNPPDAPGSLNTGMKSVTGVTNPAASAVRPAVSTWSEQVYKVGAGDTWDKICQKQYGSGLYAPSLKSFNIAHPRSGETLNKDGNPVAGHEVYLPPIEEMRQMLGKP